MPATLYYRFLERPDESMDLEVHVAGRLPTPKELSAVNALRSTVSRLIRLADSGRPPAKPFNPSTLQPFTPSTP